MTAKIPSEIIRIDLHEASYKDTGCHIEPTHVNFFLWKQRRGKVNHCKGYSQRCWRDLCSRQNIRGLSPACL